MTFAHTLPSGSNKRVLPILLISVCLWSQPGISDEQETTRAEIQALEGDIEHLRTLLDSLNTQQASARRQIQHNNQSIQQLSSEIKILENRRLEGQGEVKKLVSRQQQLAAKSEAQKVQAVRSLRSLYRGLGESRIKLLLNQENPAAVSRQLVYLDYFQQAQLQAIGNYEQTVAELQTLESQQHQLIARLEQEKSAIDHKKQTLVKQQARQQQLLAELGQRHRQGGRELKQLEQERERLDKVLASIVSRQQISAQPFKSRQGKLAWPVSGKVLFSFNDQNPETRLRWQGMFIAADAGTTVNAVHDGRVIFANWLSGYGLLAILDHGDQYLTLYAHNNAILKQEGDTVLAGEPLAVSGESGAQQTEGVYFEVRHQGKPQNPAVWLAR